MTNKHNQFQVLKSLEYDPKCTQRKLSKELGMSLGKANYCLKSLIAKGLVKINKFKNSKNKNQYSYLLTTKGLEEIAILTIEFINIKTKEYDNLRKEIENLREEARRHK